MAFTSSKKFNTYIYIAPYSKHLTLKVLRYGSHSVIPAFNLHTHSPDGAMTDCSGRHLVAACWSFIDPERRKG